MRQGMRVIDVDTHVTPSVEVLMRYADQELKARADELKPYTRVMEPSAAAAIRRDSYGSCASSPCPITAWPARKARPRRLSRQARARAALSRAAWTTSPVRASKSVSNTTTRRAGSATWTSRASISTSSSLAPGRVELGARVKLAQGLYGAYHRYMADYCSADSRRLKGLILAPGADPQWAANTIREQAKEDWPAAVWPILPEGLPVDDPDLDADLGGDERSEPAHHAPQLLLRAALLPRLSRHLGQRRSRAHGRASGAPSGCWPTS